ncbi:MAG: DUF4058 family protein [Gemmataceae bacterium]
MPLRDHFRAPLDDETSWDGFHGQWPAMIVLALNEKLPPRYVAAPRVHTVATFERETSPSSWEPEETGGGTATAVWAPAQPTLSLVTDLPDLPEYEVRVYDSKRGRRLVAAIEIVSPANKDRPEHRAAFVAKCASLLQQQVSVAVVDLVTTRHFNLYAELLKMMGQHDPSPAGLPPLYVAEFRFFQRGDHVQRLANSLIAVKRRLPVTHSRCAEPRRPRDSSLPGPAAGTRSHRAGAFADET